jgi:hypothetical protein
MLEGHPPDPIGLTRGATTYARERSAAADSPFDRSIDQLFGEVFVPHFRLGDEVSKRHFGQHHRRLT